MGRFWFEHLFLIIVDVNFVESRRNEERVQAAHAPCLRKPGSGDEAGGFFLHVSVGTLEMSNCARGSRYMSVVQLTSVHA